MTKLAYSPEDAAAALGVTRSRIYKLISTGDLRSYKDGKRRLCSHQALIEYQRNQEKAAAAGPEMR